MTIRPIDLNGMIQRADDVSHMKRMEDSKALHDQQNIQTQVDKREDELAHRVVDADDPQNANNNGDAKDEGRNKYFYQSKDKVIKKDKPQGKFVNNARDGRIDIKI